jgi:hypothetical protein
MDREDASRARDLSTIESSAEDSRKKLAELKMIASKGDFTLVAAVQMSCDQRVFISKHVLLKCDARSVTIRSVDRDSAVFESLRKDISLPLRTFKRVFVRCYPLIDLALESFTTLRTVFFFDFGGMSARCLLLLYPVQARRHHAPVVRRF